MTGTRRLVDAGAVSARAERPAERPWDWNGHCRTGERHARAGEWRDAQVCFESAVSADPRRAGLWVALAVAARHAGDLFTARGALDMAAVLVDDVDVGTNAAVR